MDARVVIETIFERLVEKVGHRDLEFVELEARAIYDELVESDEEYIEFEGVGIVATREEMLADPVFFIKVITLDLLIDRL